MSNCTANRAVTRTFTVGAVYGAFAEASLASFVSFASAYRAIYGGVAFAFRTFIGSVARLAYSAAFAIVTLAGERAYAAAFADAAANGAIDHCRVRRKYRHRYERQKHNCRQQNT